MPGSATSPGRTETRDVASARIAFRRDKSVSARNNYLSRLNGWPMRPPADASPRTSRSDDARLGANADRYSFIAADFHRLLLASLPAHCHRNPTESKPKDCPPGTKPINKTGVSKAAVHGIKEGVQAKPEDWTGITPDGDVITTNPDGSAENHGPYKNYLP